MIPITAIGRHEIVGQKNGERHLFVDNICGADFTSEDEEKRQNAMDWAANVAEPWSHVRYNIHVNYRFKADTPKSETWIAECIIPVYDGITAYVFAYGSDEVDALKNVMQIMDEVIQKYAPKEEDE